MNYRISSPEKAQILDIDALRALTKELGLPVFNRDEEYRALKQAGSK